MARVSVPKSDLWRRIRAKCFDCRCRKRNTDCELVTCPFYDLLKAGKLEPENHWWQLPSREWAEALDRIFQRKFVKVWRERRAERPKKKRRIRITVK